MRRSRLHPRGTVDVAHRSMPNLNREPDQDPANGVDMQSGDIRFNPSDLLPRETDIFDGNIEFYVGIRNVLITTLKGCLVALVLINVAAILLDPTPLFRAMRYVSIHEKNDCDVSCKIDLQSTELKAIEDKLRDLEIEINIISNGLSNLTHWRFGVEYEILKTYSKTKQETLEYIEKLETKMVNALSLYDADKLGIVDYALESAGGAIVSTPDTIPYPSKTTSAIMGVIKLYSPSDPSMVIQPGMLPGQCFSFHGQSGRVRIKLAQMIQITSVTLEHTHPGLLSDTTSCPKEFKVYGLRHFDDSDVAEQMILGTFVYQRNETTLQNFKIHAQYTIFEYVELRILSNYGNNDYTCVYRFRVHGNTIN